MNNQGETRRRNELKAKVDKATLYVTIASTFVAVAATVAAFWSSYEAHETRVDDERPFLIGEPSGHMTTPLYMPIRITNNGQSTAKNIRVGCEDGMDLSNSRVTWQETYLKSPAATFTYLHPKQWVEIGCSISQANAPHDFGNIVELGVIQYQDLRNNTYVTPFCMTFVVPSGTIDVHMCPDTRHLPNLE